MTRTDCVCAAPNLAPVPRPASAVACDLRGAGQVLIDLAERADAGRAAATDLDALARGLQRCASELRAQESR